MKRKDKIINRGLVLLAIIGVIGMLCSVFGLGYTSSELNNLNSNQEAIEMCKLECYNHSLQFLEEPDISISGFYEFACVDGCYIQALEVLRLS